MSDAPSLAVLVVYALATARLTGMITGADEITAAPVLWLIRKINPAKLESGWRFTVAYGVACMWCASVYVGMLAMAPLAYWHPLEPWAMLPAMGLAFSWVTGATSEWGR